MGGLDKFRLSKHRFKSHPYINSGLIMMLDPKNNAGDGIYDSSSAFWKDSLAARNAAYKAAGNVSWGADYLRLDGSTYWNCQAPNLTTGSTGTVEIVVSIDADFVPVNNTLWYVCSCIWGCELSGTQQDYGIIINGSGYYSVGYSTSTIYASTVSALTGLKHTITVVYNAGLKYFYIDGVLISNVNHSGSGTHVSMYGLGWNNSAAATKIKGNIYGVRFYNRSLSADEIAHNYKYDQAA